MSNTAWPNELTPVVSAECYDAMRRNGVFADGGIGRNWLRTATLDGRPGKSVEFPLSSSDRVTITPDEKIASAAVSVRQLQENGHGAALEAGQGIGKRLAERLDLSVALRFPELTYNCGQPGIDASHKHLLDGINKLVVNRAPKPYLCLMHPQQWYDLLTEASSPLTAITGYGNIAEEIGYFVVQLYGMTVVVHPDVPLDEDEENRCGAILSNRAFALAEKWGLRITTTDLDETHVEVRGSMCYDVGLLDTDAGVAFTTDA